MFAIYLSSKRSQKIQNSTFQWDRGKSGIAKVKNWFHRDLDEWIQAAYPFVLFNTGDLERDNLPLAEFCV